MAATSIGSRVAGSTIELFSIAVRGRLPGTAPEVDVSPWVGNLASSTLPTITFASASAAALTSAALTGGGPSAVTGPLDGDGGLARKTAPLPATAASCRSGAFGKGPLFSSAIVDMDVVLGSLAVHCRGAPEAVCP